MRTNVLWLMLAVAVVLCNCAPPPDRPEHKSNQGAEDTPALVRLAQFEPPPDRPARLRGTVETEMPPPDRPPQQQPAPLGGSPPPDHPPAAPRPMTIAPIGPAPRTR